MKKTLIHIFWVFFALSLFTVPRFFSSASHSASASPTDFVPALADVRKIFSGAARLEPSSAAGVFAVFEDPRGEKKAGYAFLTPALAPEVRGYGGPIRILVCVDLSGAVSGVRTLSHSETPSVAAGIDSDWWTVRFRGLSAGFDPSRVDAVSGATVSSSAYVEALRRSLDRLSAQGLFFSSSSAQAQGGAEPSLARPGKNFWIVLFLLLLSAAAFLSRNGVFRLIVLGLGCAGLGFVAKTLLSVGDAAWLVREVFSSDSLWRASAALLLGSLVLSLLFGRLYCGYLCPFGALQEFLKRIVPFRAEPPARLDAGLKAAKYLLLWILVAAGAIFSGLDYARFEPFSALVLLSTTASGWAFFAVLLAAGALIERFYCRYLCFAGAFQGVFSRWALFPARPVCRGKAACGACERFCPMACLRGAGGFAAECIGCNRCLHLCPEDGRARND